MDTFYESTPFKLFAVFMIGIMCLVSFVPNVQAGFVPTSESAADILRQKDMKVVQSALENKIIKQRLMELGYSEEEIQTRVARLSDEELHKLATDMETLTPAGDALGTLTSVLVLILIVLLIWVVLDKAILDTY